MHYSEDFRKKVLEHTNTHTIHETAKTFGIGPSTVTRWMAMFKKTGSLKPAPIVRKPSKLDYIKLREYVDANPDRYIREIAEVFKCAKETVRKALIKLGYTQKKEQIIQRGRTPRGKKIIGEV
jgi:transposase